MENLFVYGTLMCEDIMRDVSGCVLGRAVATLVGYQRKQVRGEEYPGLVEEPAGRVEGVVYHRIPESAWERLDRFEGEMYERHTVGVRLGDGEHASAQTYVVRPRFRDRLSDVEWDFADFLRRGKERFQNGYEGYESL
jgi:gamma-glutamylcyclotransferase (GGCT)/AIG2-like uncharacterized protein YtfP